MIPLGLTAFEQQAYHKALVGSVSDGPKAPSDDGNFIHIRIKVELLDMEERPIQDLSDWLLGGQVTVDMDADVTRSLQLTLLDPDGQSGIDAGAPVSTLRLDKMVSVEYGVWVNQLGRWVDCPVFRGVLSKASRDGETLEVEALGKEHLLMQDAGWTKVYPAGVRRTWVIADIARRSGERNYDIPTWPARTSKTGTMIRLKPATEGSKWTQSHPWIWMQHAAKSMRAQLWYDGAGTLRLRQKTVRPSFWFYDNHVLTLPKVTLDDDDVFNTVWVKGEGRVESIGSIAASHPNSVQNLARRGVKRYLVDTIEDSEIRTWVDAAKARDRRLKEISVADFNVEFESFVIPHLDPDDLCHLMWERSPGAFRLRKFTIPLSPGDGMSVGYVRETRRTPAMLKARRMRARNRVRQARGWR